MLTNLILDRIEVDNRDGVYKFVAVMKRRGEELHVATPIEGLLSYSTFQRVVLLSTGWLFLPCDIEGAAPDAADAQWRSAVASRLELGRQAQAAQEGQ